MGDVGGIVCRLLYQNIKINLSRISFQLYRTINLVLNQNDIPNVVENARISREKKSLYFS